jgi:hypothetical protein
MLAKMAPVSVARRSHPAGPEKHAGMPARQRTDEDGGRAAARGEEAASADGWRGGPVVRRRPQALVITASDDLESERTIYWTPARARQGERAGPAPARDRLQEMCRRNLAARSGELLSAPVAEGTPAQAGRVTGAQHQVAAAPAAAAPVYRVAARTGTGAALVAELTEGRHCRIRVGGAPTCDWRLPGPETVYFELIAERGHLWLYAHYPVEIDGQLLCGWSTLESGRALLVCGPLRLELEVSGGGVEPAASPPRSGTGGQALASAAEAPFEDEFSLPAAAQQAGAPAPRPRGRAGSRPPAKLPFGLKRGPLVRLAVVACLWIGLLANEHLGGKASAAGPEVKAKVTGASHRAAAQGPGGELRGVKDRSAAARPAPGAALAPAASPDRAAPSGAASSGGADPALAAPAPGSGAERAVPGAAAGGPEAASLAPGGEGQVATVPSGAAGPVSPAVSPGPPRPTRAGRPGRGGPGAHVVSSLLGEPGRAAAPAAAEPARSAVGEHRTSVYQAASALMSEDYAAALVYYRALARTQPEPYRDFAHMVESRLRQVCDGEEGTGRAECDVLLSSP